MKLNLHPASYLVKFSCISCHNEFEAYSSSKKDNLKMDVCAKCNTFYTGKSSVDVKTGKIEMFKQRERKSSSIRGKKNPNSDTQK